MVNKAATKVAFLPTLSPKCPKNAEPSGLAKKAIEKVANDSSNAVVGLDEEKNSDGKTSKQHLKLTVFYFTHNNLNII